MERAVVIHDPQVISAEAIQETIEDRGFDAEVLSTDLATPSLDQSKSELNSSDEHLLATTTVAIEGMTCGACTAAVEGGFKDLPGMKNFSISLLSERAVIDHDPQVLTSDQIAEIIEDRGFGAEILDSVEKRTEVVSEASSPESTIATTTVAVEGMTCGACTAAVEGLQGFGRRTEVQHQPVS